MSPPVLRLALLVLAAPAMVAAVSPKAAEPAAARALGASVRRTWVKGDVVCGESTTHRPFLTFANATPPAIRTPKDGLSLEQGVACFDREIKQGRPGAGAPACRGYDFGFYFAFDHFCR